MVRCNTIQDYTEQKYTIRRHIVHEEQISSGNQHKDWGHGSSDISDRDTVAAACWPRGAPLCLTAWARGDLHTEAGKHTEREASQG